MARHEIPTHLDVEDKILGPLTTRDALYLLLGASAAYGVWTNPAPPPWARLLVAGVVALVALLFALVKIRGRPLEGWLFAALTYAVLPRRAVWTPEPTRAAHSDRSPTALRPPYRLRMRWRAHPMPGSDRR